ncbi:MAG: hypothetical protein QM535_19690 [Limnohabitans sp.]|nr:hypothetical protein [Limnohabitans sp.]
MKKIIVILMLFLFQIGISQNGTRFTLYDIPSYNSKITFELKDKFENDVNKILFAKNFSLIKIIKNDTFNIYTIIKKNDIRNLKNNKKVHYRGSEIFLNDKKNKLLVSVTYDSSNYLILRKKQNKFYIEYEHYYKEIDCITFFDYSLNPLLSIKYIGSLAIENHSMEHKPYCVYDYKENKTYFFDIDNEILNEKFRCINISDIVNEIKSKISFVSVKSGKNKVYYNSILLDGE